MDYATIEDSKFLSKFRKLVVLHLISDTAGQLNLQEFGSVIYKNLEIIDKQESY